jgi:hypothetical protein
MSRWLRSVGLSCASLIVHSVYAQSLGFQTPVSGLIFNQASSKVLTLAGIPGAAMLGDVWLDGAQGANLSRDGDSAIVWRGDSLFGVAGLKSNAPTWRDLQLNPTTYVVTWAGRKALVASDGRLYEVSFGSGDSSVSPLAFDLSGLSVKTLAFDPSANRVLVAAQGGIYAGTTEEGALRLILPLANPVGLVTAASDAFVGDRDTGDIYRIRGFGNGGAPEKFMAATQAESRVVGLALSADGKRLYAADGGVLKLWVYGIATGLLNAGVDLSFTPDRLEPVSAGSLLILKDGDGPLFLLDDKAEPRVFFVPISRPGLDSNR